MAIGDPYASPTELEARRGLADDGTYTEALTAASRAVETFTHRQFNKTDVASQRRFEALNPELLPVDDFHTTTDLAIEVDGIAWTADDVDPRPWNGIVDGQTGWPFYELYAETKCWPSRRRVIGVARPAVHITAKWGWVSVPTAIKLVTLTVAATAINGGNTAPVRSESIDGYSVSYATSVMLAAAVSGIDLGPFAQAAPYRRRQFGLA